MPLQIIGSEIHFEGYRIGTLDEAAAPPTIIARASDYIDGSDAPEGWVLEEDLDDAETERDAAREDASELESANKTLHEQLDTAVAGIDEIIDGLAPHADAISGTRLRDAVAEALTELRALKEKLL